MLTHGGSETEASRGAGQILPNRELTASAETEAPRGGGQILPNRELTAGAEAEGPGGFIGRPPWEMRPAPIRLQSFHLRVRRRIRRRHGWRSLWRWRWT